MNTTHPIANPETGECGDPACPCHGFASKSPSGASRPEIEQVGFLDPESKNVSEGDSKPVGAILDTMRCLDCHGTGKSSARQVCVYCHGDGQVETYAARQRRLSSESVPAVDFEREWVEAPRAMVNYVEQEIAEYWFLRGMRAGEVKVLTESTATFRTMAEQRGLIR